MIFISGTAAEGEIDTNGHIVVLWLSFRAQIKKLKEWKRRSSCQYQPVLPQLIKLLSRDEIVRWLSLASIRVSMRRSTPDRSCRRLSLQPHDESILPGDAPLHQHGMHEPLLCPWYTAPTSHEQQFSNTCTRICTFVCVSAIKNTRKLGSVCEKCSRHELSKNKPKLQGMKLFFSWRVRKILITLLWSFSR